MQLTRCLTANKYFIIVILLTLAGCIVYVKVHSIKVPYKTSYSNMNMGPWKKSIVFVIMCTPLLYSQAENINRRCHISYVYSNGYVGWSYGNPPSRQNIICTDINLENGLWFGQDCSHCQTTFQIVASDIQTLPSSIFTNLSLTTKLQLTNIKMENILPGAFNSLKYLVELDISNNKLTNILDGTFNSLVSLQILDLSRNNITSLNMQNLSHTNITHLNLSSNAIKIFNNNLFSLKVLDLSFNQIHDFDFFYSKKLDTLNISNNYLSVINGCITTLKILDVSRNKLKSLKNFTCSNETSNTIDLNVSYNFISNIDPEEMSTLHKLQNLSLQNNHISEIPHGCFQNLSNLYSLNLSSNILEKFPYGIFDHLNNLKIFDLSNNKLSSFKQPIYHLLGALRKLYLHSNELVYLNSKNVKDSLSHLESISLDNNKFTCENLLEVIHDLKYKVLKGTCVKTSNINGIQCIESEYSSNNVEPVGNAKQTIQFEHHPMDDYFNKDFENTKFYKYLEGLQTERKSNIKFSENLNNYLEKDFKNSNFVKYFNSIKDNEDSFNNEFSKSVMYNYFNKGFMSSNFFRYLESLRSLRYVVENENSSRVAQLVSHFGAESNDYTSSLNAIVILLVTIICLLILSLFIVYNKVNVVNRLGVRDESVELMES